MAVKASSGSFSSKLTLTGAAYVYNAAGVLRSTEEAQNLVNYLPSYMQDGAVVRKIMETLGRELQRVTDSRIDIENQINLTTATWGLSWWEQMVGLRISQSEDYEARRSAVLTALARTATESEQVFLQNITFYSDPLGENAPPTITILDPRTNPYEIEINISQYLFEAPPASAIAAASVKYATAVGYWKLGDNLTDFVSTYSTDLSDTTPTAYWRLGDGATSGAVANYSVPVLATGPTLYFRLDEASGTSVSDASGNGHTGTHSGSPTLGAAGALLSDTNTGATYDGTNAQTSAPITATTGSFSAACWVNTSTNRLQNILSSHNGSSGGWNLYMTGAGGLVAFHTCTGGGAHGYTPSSTTGLVVGTWAHVAVTYDGGTNTKTLYVNGLAVGTATHVMGISSSTFGISSQGVAGQRLAGSVDEAAYWTSALTPRQVLDLYEAGAGLRTTDTMGTHHGIQGSGVLAGITGALTGDDDTCFDFDGTNDRVVIPYSSALATANVSVSAWIMRDTDTGGVETIYEGRNAARTQGHALYIDSSDKLVFAVYDGAVGHPLASTDSLATGVWYHVAGTYDGTTSRLYLNGRPAATPTAFAYTPATSGNIHLGIKNSIADAFNGKIDEVALHSTVLTDQQIADLAGAGQGYRAIDENNGHNGVTVGSPTLGTGGAITGTTDTAYTFDRSDDRIVIPYSSLLNTALVTWAAWVYIDDSAGAGTQRYIIDSSGSAGTTGFRVEVAANDKIKATFYKAAGASAAAEETIAKNVWKHVAVKYDGTNITIYIDGAAGTPVALGAAYVPTTGYPMTIGGSITASNFFKGKLDEVALFDTALSGADITDLVASDAYSYLVTFLFHSGESSEGSSLSEVIAVPTDSGVELSNIPISERPECLGRRLYRKRASAGATYFWVDTGVELANNYTTTYTDNEPTDTAEALPAETTAGNALKQGLDLLIQQSKPAHIKYTLIGSAFRADLSPLDEAFT